MLTMGTALSQQVDANWQTYIMIAVYFFVTPIVICFYGYKQATGNLSETRWIGGNAALDRILLHYQLELQI